METKGTTYEVTHRVLHRCLKEKASYGVYKEDFKRYIAFMRTYRYIVTGLKPISEEEYLKARAEYVLREG